MEESSVFFVFNIVNEGDAMVINCPNYLFCTKVNKTLDPC